MIFNKHIWIFILSLVFINNLNAQQHFTLSGKVVNKDKLPVEFVHATLLKNDTVFVEGMATDSLGAFLFKAEKGNYRLILEQFGTEYFNKYLELNQDIDLQEIEIDEFVMLEGVMITAMRNLVSHSGDKLIFDIENSPLREGYNGLEILRRSPKLQISSDGSVQLRKKEVQIHINGRKTNMSQEDLNSYLASLSSEDIKSIEIQDVGGAEEEASNSGGVVNILLKKGSYGFRGIIKAGYSHYESKYNNAFGDVNLTYGQEKWNTYLIYGASKNNNKGKYNNEFVYRSNSRIQQQEGAFFNNNKSYNLRTGIMFYPSVKHEFGVEFFTRNTKDKFIDNQLVKIYDPALVIDGETNSLTKDMTNIWYLTINYKYTIDTLGSYLKFIGDYGSNKLSRNNTGEITYGLGSIENSSFLFDSKAPSTYYTGQIDWSQNLKSNWQLFSGIKFNRIDRNNELYSYERINQDWQLIPTGNEDFENSENIFAVYSSIEKSINKSNYLKIGLRGEHTSTKGRNELNGEDVAKSYFDLFPTLFYKYSMDSKRFFSLSYRRSIFRPSFRDLNPFIIKQSDFLYQKGNPELTPQYNQRIDFTYGANKNEISFFTRFSKDLIQQVYFVEGDINYVQPLNFGKENNTGIDHTYSGNISKWLYTNISSGVYYYSFRSAELKESRPTFYNYIYLQAKLPKNVMIELFSNYDYRSQYRNTLGAYQYGLDLIVQKRMLKDQLIAKLAITDLLNTRRDKNFSTYQDFTFDFYQKRLTRALSLSVQYTFKNKGKTKYSNVESDNQSRNRL